jgi:hypothetical protein
MPIKGVTDRPRLPRLGKIRLGVKVEPEGKASYPRATNYFVCPPEVQEVFGAEPKELAIAFPTDDPDICASHWYRAYSARGLVCKGDGERADRLVDMKATVSGEGELPDSLHPTHWKIATARSESTARHEIECPPATCPQFASKACRPIANIQFMLPDVRGLGIWQIDTSSWHSIRNVLSGLQLVQSLIGRVSGIPLTLALVDQQVQPEGQAKKTVHVLRLTAPYLLRDLYRQAALPRGEVFMLPAPDLDAPDDLVPEEVTDAVEAEGVTAVTVDDFFQPDEPEQRKGAWDAVQKIIASGDPNFTRANVIKWLAANADVRLDPELLEDRDPPAAAELPTKALTALHDAMGVGQMRLDERPAGYAG